MERLFKQIIEAGQNLPKTCIITEIRYEEGASIVNTVELQQRGKFIKLQVSEDRVKLTVKMFMQDDRHVSKGNADTSQPSNKIMASSGELSSDNKGVPWKLYSSEEILAFVERVGDLNPIHRQAPYIVPGCLLLAELKQLSGFKMAILRFHRSVYAGETIYIYETEDCIEGFTTQKVFTLKRKECYHD